MTRTVNANSVKIVAEDSKEGILLSVSQDGKLATNKIDNQGNVDNQASALTSNFISLTDTPEAFQAEKYLKVNAQGNALEFSDISISTNFISLTDTPNAFKAGSYLRVNTAGDAIEQIKTAPPDGGAGDKSLIQAHSKFAGKLPDAIVVRNSGYSMRMVLRSVYDGDANGAIEYMDPFSPANANSGYISFYNNATGTGIRNITSGYAIPNGRTSLQDVINDGNAIYHGQKGGSSGVGRLSYWKQTYGTPKGSNNVSWKFMHDLPDAIVTKDGDGIGGYWDSPYTISDIGYNDNVANPTSIDVYYRNPSDASYYIIFNLNTVDGDYRTSNKVDLTELTGSTPRLVDYIEGGRALYYGAPHGDSVKTGTYISDGTNTQQINLGFRPKMVTIKGVHTTDSDDTYTGTNYFYDQTVFDTISESGDYIPRPYRATDSRLVGHVDTTNEQVEIEINDTGFKIVGPFKAGGAPSNNSAANMLGAKYHYFAIGPDVSVSGDGASSVEQLTDVDVTTTPPSAGQVLVYDDADSKWKPGAQSTDFTDLTDTPETLDAGSYLRVNTTGDAIEQIKTAPPDGGRGGNSLIQEKSKFAGKLPDVIIAINGSYAMPLVLRSVYDGDTSGSIEYMDPYGGGSAYVAFYNNPTGDGLRWITTGFTIPNGRTSLQAIIDDGNAVFHGQKSGTSGAGSLSVIKAATDNFYTDLPDAIVVTHAGGYETIMRLKFAKSLTDQSDGQNFYYEARFDTGSADYLMVFKDDEDGTFMGHAGQSDNFPANGSMDQTLRWYIENGRALYYGGQQDFGVKAWGAFDGTQGSGNNYTITGFSGGNVASIVRISTGLYKVTFINPMPHADYSISGSCNPNGTGGSFFGVRQRNNPVTATDFHIELRDNSNGFRNNDRISFQVVC